MKNNEDYFKTVTITKIAIITIFFFFIMMVMGAITSKGEIPPVKEFITKQSLELDTSKTGWPTQVLYDSVQACYQGTYRWIVLSNPALIGIIPPPQQQRAMIEHCFCVLDRVRKQYKFVEYMKVAPNQEAIGNLCKLIEPAMITLGLTKYIKIIEEILIKGTGSSRQRQLYERSSNFKYMIKSLKEQFFL